MGAESELQPGGTDGAEIGLGKILLAQMDEVAALLDRQTPKVVDDQLAAMGRADRFGNADLVSDILVASFLDPELHQLDAERHQAFDPSGAVDDEVERVERHEKTAFPMTGVEGTAMSRGSSMPAPWAMCPASIAAAKASAMAAGSSAPATAVLRSTAS